MSVLKPLSRALADGDTIRALVRNVASNQDGRTRGRIIQPSGDLQAQLIQDTYSRAGLDMASTRFFEEPGPALSLATILKYAQPERASVTTEPMRNLYMLEP